MVFLKSVQTNVFKLGFGGIFSFIRPLLSDRQLTVAERSVTYRIIVKQRRRNKQSLLSNGSVNNGSCYVMATKQQQKIKSDVICRASLDSFQSGFETTMGRVVSELFDCRRPLRTRARKQRTLVKTADWKDLQPDEVNCRTCELAQAL
jgi:hypothetical protein